MSRTLTRRAVIGGGAALGSLTIVSRTGLAADFKFRQFHNQAVSSPLHKRLVEMWAAVKTETTAVWAPRYLRRMQALRARTVPLSRW